MSERFFLRFRWSDPKALEREIDDARLAHASASGTAAEAEAACRLGIALTAADRESEAASLLDATLTKARHLPEATPAAWVLLYLATARQYLGERTVAQSMFDEALTIATAHELREVEHYVLHHRGRCYAEQNDLAEAKRCFERALEIRLELGEPRAERTRQAIAALNEL
jgi:tetratricopeptide (TPR) repeat protein